MANNFMSTYPPMMFLALDRNQQSFDEDISSNVKGFKNTDIKSMMNIDHQQNQNEKFNRELFIKNNISL